MTSSARHFATTAAVGLFAVASTPFCAVAADLVNQSSPQSDISVTAPPWSISPDDEYGNSSANFTSTTFRQYDLMEVYDVHLAPIINFDRYITLVWYAIGYTGNLVAFYVWIQRNMLQSSGCYLAALAAADFIFLLLHVIYELQTVWSVMILNHAGLCEAYPVFFYATQYLSPLFVLAFTVERYISICHPFQRDKFCTTRRAVMVIVCMCVGSVVLHSVQGYLWHYSAEAKECSPRSEELLTIWGYITDGMIFVVVSLCIICLNVLVIVSAKKIEAHEKSLLGNGGGGNQRRGGRSVSVTTVTLMAVSFYHVATTLPVTVMYVVLNQFSAGDFSVPMDEIPNDPIWRRHLNYMTARKIIEKIGMTHYASNIFIYILTGAKFRQELRRMFARCLPCLRESNNYGSTNTLCCCHQCSDRSMSYKPSLRQSKADARMTVIGGAGMSPLSVSDVPSIAHHHGDMRTTNGDAIEMLSANEDNDDSTQIRTGNGYQASEVAVGAPPVVVVEDVDEKQRTIVTHDDVEKQLNTSDVKRGFDDEDDYIRRDSGCVTLDAGDCSRRQSEDIKRDCESL